MKNFLFFLASAIPERIGELKATKRNPSDNAYEYNAVLTIL
jgi:hypothetical protein